MPRTSLRSVVMRMAGAIFDWRGGEYRTGGLRFAVPKELTSQSFRGRFVFGNYELPERLLLRRLPTDGTVLDLGGCLGVVSCLLNRRLRDPSRHLVVEANPALVPWLERNRDANRARFAVAHGVLAPGGGNRDFWPGTKIVGGSAHRPGGVPLAVPALDLADLEAARGMRFDVLVVDIEGGEADFVADHPALLRRSRAVLMEFHPQFIGADACAAVRDSLAAAGLRRAARIAAAELWLR